MSDKSETESETMPSSSANSSRTFRIPLHSENILSMLNKQRETGEYCDVTVLVEHQRFSAHKCVLAANSPYLQALMAGNNDGILLRQISSESFKSIIDFMYTSKLQLLAATVQEILNAAKLLQIRSVVSICCRYLESQLMHIAKDVTGEKTHKTRHSVHKPSVIAVDSKFQQPNLHVGQPMANSTMLQSPPGQYYNNGNIPYTAHPPASTYNGGRQSVLPNYLPHDYNKLPQDKHMQSPTKRYLPPQQPPQQPSYRPYHSGRTNGYNQERRMGDVQSMYPPRNDPTGRSTRGDFYPPPQWGNPGPGYSKHPQQLQNPAYYHRPSRHRQNWVT